MRPSRRWFQYSLRSFLVVLTALAVWLGIVVNRARDQREAVEAIEALGVKEVIYDFQIIGTPYDGSPDPDPPHTENRIFQLNAEPPGPLWLRRLIGEDFFQEVVAVTCFPETTDSDVERALPHLRQLRGLKRVHYWADISDDMHRRLQAALPDSFVKSLSIGPY